MPKQPLISIIVPICNELKNIPLLYKALDTYTKKLPFRFEMLFVDDGSTDGSLVKLEEITKGNKSVRILEFARNFGKEAAVTAGLHAAKGDAAIMMDADLQHPPKLLSTFIAKWQAGADVVVGVRAYSKDESWFKKFASAWFYRIFRVIASTDVIPRATDYRLLDRCVLTAFNSFTERDRMTRGLIDWLGFQRDYVHFESPPREHGKASYSYKKLFGLAISSFTAHSMLPLRLAGYLGFVILMISGPLGVFVYVEKYILSDPYGLNITGTAVLAIILLFLIGIVLVCLGLVALYIARIHTEVTNRPLYIIRARSTPIEERVLNEEMES